MHLSSRPDEFENTGTVALLHAGFKQFEHAGALLAQIKFRLDVLSYKMFLYSLLALLSITVHLYKMAWILALHKKTALLLTPERHHQLWA